ncbi:MAG: aspartyl protease family protein [Flavobacteriaceae bacterium]|nr:aspartyl protease family protein [Flavobacteriaceae bacterium]
MNNKYYNILLALFFVLISTDSFGQRFNMLGNDDSYKTSFKLIHNLIIIPIEINDKKLTFILDSGVSSTVIFNLTPSDSLKMNNVKKIYIRGLGDGEPIEALHSRGNRFKMGKLFATNNDLYIVYKEKLDFSAKLGITIHGLIGYDLLKDFVVTIDYVKKRITFTKPKKYKYRRCNRCETFDLEFYRNKPYINGEITVIEPHNKRVPVKLLIDSGGTDSVWLFEDDNIIIPQKSFRDFIGEGMTGSIFGMRSKLKSFKLKSFVFKEPNVAYLDSTSSLHARKFKDRNGSIGGNILKRFKVIFDYPNLKITLKKNSNFKESFGYNLSGIELMHAGQELVQEKSQAAFTVSKGNETLGGSNSVIFDYNYKYVFKPLYSIFQVRKDSPAETVGIEVGDVLIKLNGIFVYNYSLQQLIEKFHGKKNRIIKLVVNRKGKQLKFEFKLKDILE